MAQSALKKDNHLKKVIAGRVSLETHAELYRRAALDRRPFSQWLELVLDEYIQTHPVKTVTLVPPEDE